MHDRLPEPELDARGVDLGVATPADAEVDRPRVVDGRAQRGGQRRAVGRSDDGQAGQGAHDRDVLGRVMRRAVEAQREPGVVADQSDGQAGKGDVGADLLAAEQREEGREGRDVGPLAGRGDPGRRRDHVLLRDPELEEPLRVPLLEAEEAVRVLEVRGAGDDRVAFVAEVGQRVGQRAQPGRLVEHRVQVPRALAECCALHSPPPISASARSSSSRAR